MAKRWSVSEDSFLLDYHGVGADFIASHDLGRPNGAGSRRLRFLSASGAREAYLRMKLAELDFMAATNRVGELDATMREVLEAEHAEALAAIFGVPT